MRPILLDENGWVIKPSIRVYRETKMFFCAGCGEKVRRFASSTKKHRCVECRKKYFREYMRRRNGSRFVTPLRKKKNVDSAIARYLKGKTSPQIAKMLGVSVSTVEYHLRKSGVWKGNKFYAKIQQPY